MMPLSLSSSWIGMVVTLLVILSVSWHHPVRSFQPAVLLANPCHPCRPYSKPMSSTIHHTLCWGRQQSNEEEALYNGEDGGNIDNEEEEDLELEYEIDAFLRGDYEYSMAPDAALPHPGLSPSETVETALRGLRRLNQPTPDHGAAVFLKFCYPLSRNERWGDSFTTSSPSSSSSSSSSDSSTKRDGITSSTRSQQHQQQQPGEGSKSTTTRHRSGADKGSVRERDQWKEILRGALTPQMFGRRIRATSEFCGLLDWTHLDVTTGTAYRSLQSNNELMTAASFPSIAFVNVALYFDDRTRTKKGGGGKTDMEPVLFQFTLRRTPAGQNGVWLIDSARRSPKELFMGQE